MPQSSRGLGRGKGQGGARGLTADWPCLSDCGQRADLANAQATPSAQFLYTRLKKRRQRLMGFGFKLCIQLSETGLMANAADHG